MKRLILALLAFGTMGSGDARAPVASDWAQGFNNKTRLIAGRATHEGKAGLYAGVEIAIPGGWKTYWRTPGDAGGVPPDFDWQGSENLAAAHVEYPAPHRLHDEKAGDAVGYKDGVVFPVLLTPKDAAKGVELHAKISYGICKDICIPAEAELQISIPSDVGTSDALSGVLAKVPGSTLRPGIDPALSSWKHEQSGAQPVLSLIVKTKVPTTADAFVEVPGGLYVPLPKRLALQDGEAAFEVDLSGVDLKDLKGKPLTVTMVDANGQSETTITLE